VLKSGGAERVFSTLISLIDTDENKDIIYLVASIIPEAIDFVELRGDKLLKTPKQMDVKKCC